MTTVVRGRRKKRRELGEKEVRKTVNNIEVFAWIIKTLSGTNLRTNSFVIISIVSIL